MNARSITLREIMQRDAVTPVFGVPAASFAQIMESCGAEVGFIGTKITLGNYTGLPDTGVVTMTESIMAARYIAKAVSFPLIIDGDTGYGGSHAVQRLVEECIEAGLSGLRLDDQAIETKRTTLDDGIQIVSRDAAVERYAAAVEKRDELDPNFVIMAQCYARDAVGSDLDECIHRLNLYAEEGGVDWVQFEAPHSVEEIQHARAEVSGMLTAMKGHLPRVLTLEEHKQLGLNVAWYTFYPNQVLLATCHESMGDFTRHGLQAWVDFIDSRTGNPYV